MIKTYLLFIILILSGQNIMAFQSDLAQLRNSFAAAVGKDFEIVRDFRTTRSVSGGGGTYWLVHVKPKKSGHYTLKYSYKYTHKFEYPQEGENEFYIRVGEKNCRRSNNVGMGISNFCLGDRVIIPISLNDIAGHQFSLKSDYADGKTIGLKSAPSNNFSYIEQPENPLETHLKYLGTRFWVSPHRNYGAQTVSYQAFFEAKKAGRFNLKASGSEIPIIIVNPGVPITALLSTERTTNFGDNKRFSAGSSNNFLTNLLILQPGDVFEVNFSRFVEREEIGGKKLNKTADREHPKLVIQKSLFALDKNWSYNEWLIDYLPK